MTLQEMFDKAVTGIKKQGRLSQGPINPLSGKPGNCYYRHPDDPAVRCAVGHLIPDELYDRREMEGRIVTCDAVLNTPMRDLLGILPHEDLYNVPAVSMLATLQTTHDNALTVEEFLTGAAEVARQFMLDAKVCEVTV